MYLLYFRQEMIIVDAIVKVMAPFFTTPRHVVIFLSFSTSNQGLYVHKKFLQHLPTPHLVASSCISIEIATSKFPCLFLNGTTHDGVG